MMDSNAMRALMFCAVVCGMRLHLAEPPIKKVKIHDAAVRPDEHEQDDGLLSLLKSRITKSSSEQLTSESEKKCAAQLACCPMYGRRSPQHDLLDELHILDVSDDRLRCEKVWLIHQGRPEARIIAELSDDEASVVMRERYGEDMVDRVRSWRAYRSKLPRAMDLRTTAIKQRVYGKSYSGGIVDLRCLISLVSAYRVVYASSRSAVYRAACADSDVWFGPGMSMRKLGSTLNQHCQDTERALTTEASIVASDEEEFVKWCKKSSAIEHLMQCEHGDMQPMLIYNNDPLPKGCVEAGDMRRRDGSK